MATIIYGVDSAGGGDTTYFPTKAEALKEARAEASAITGRYAIEVHRYTVTERYGIRELYCRFLNGHWAEEIEIIANISGTMPSDEE